MKVILNKHDGTESITRSVKKFQGGRYANPYRVLNFTFVKLNDDGTTDNRVYVSWSAVPTAKEKWNNFIKKLKFDFKTMFAKKRLIFLVERESWHRVPYRAYKENGHYYVKTSSNVGIVNLSSTTVRLFSNGLTDLHDWNTWEKKSGWVGDEFDEEILTEDELDMLETSESQHSTPVTLNSILGLINDVTASLDSSPTLQLDSSTNQHFPIKAYNSDKQEAKHGKSN